MERLTDGQTVVTSDSSSRSQHLYFLNNGFVSESDCPENSVSIHTLPQLNEEECARLGSFITEEYELLRKVLSSLPLVHLMKCAHVCRSWAEAVRVEKESRVWPYWFIFKREIDDMCWERFTNGIYCPASLCVWFSYRDVNKYHINSSSGIAKLHCNLIDKVRGLARSVECPLVAVAASGMVGTTTDLLTTREGPTYDGQNWFAASVLLLPKFPGVEIHPFKLTLKECRRIKEGALDSDNCNVRNVVGGPDKPVQCLLLFSRGNPHVSARLAMCLQQRQQLRMALGGAIVESVELGLQEEYIVGVLFYGDNVSATSVVLDETVQGSNIESRIRELREGSTDGEHNIALMFSCVGRGRETGAASRHNQVSRDHIESDTFRRYFRNTPLHGVIGHGEIGLDCFRAGSEELCPAKSSSESVGVADMLHIYSTVFVHLAFNISKR